MKLKMLRVSLFVFTAFLFIGCESTTLIQTKPSNAKVFVNGEYIGRSPVKYKDEKIILSENEVRIKKEGYKEFNAEFSRNEELNPTAAVAGFFLYVPWLWVMEYKEERTYILEEKATNE